MNKEYKYLAKNIGLLTISNFATKILSFFLVPLYTNILTTTEYGIYDLFQTTVTLLIPILTLNIQGAVLRFTMENNYDKKVILSIAIKYLIFSSLVVCFGLIVNIIFPINIYIKQYGIYFLVIFIVQALSEVISSYVKGCEQIKELTVSSVISTFITIVSNIIFLIFLKLGLKGYFLANILGPLMQCLYLIFKCNSFNGIDILKKYPTESKTMLAYSIPLIANTIAWWVNSASDKYVITLFRGVDEVGIYSVASKIPSIISTVTTIFGQAWFLSAVTSFDKNDNNGFFKTTYAIYNCILVLSCSLIIGLDKVLSKFLYANDFYEAWRYAPWLTIATVFNGLSGHLGGIFSAVRNSKLHAQSSVVAAIANVILNFILVPIIGPLGAAIATTICYVIMWAIRYIQSKRYISFQVRIKRDLISYILLIIQSVILLYINSSTYLYIVETVLFMMILYFYFDDIKFILNKIFKLEIRGNSNE